MQERFKEDGPPNEAILATLIRALITFYLKELMKSFKNDRLVLMKSS